jgi:2,3-bisphosphoglycerate-independent phosphoglycerate mutase
MGNPAEVKRLIIVLDGMTDWPVKELGNKTPLEAARTPVMDMFSRAGAFGAFETVPEGIHPGSEVANMSIMGYDPKKYFCHRGPLEAASQGVELLPGWTAFRLNLIWAEKGVIRSHNGGDLSPELAAEIISHLNAGLTSFRSYDFEFKFYQGVGYRHLLLVKDLTQEVICSPPHDHIDKHYAGILPQSEDGKAESFFAQLIEDSREVLSSMELVQDFKEQGDAHMPGRHPNCIWPWAPGTKPSFPRIEDKCGLKGAAISAVDLIKGLARYAGMDVIEVPGATGDWRTNYEGKATAAIDALMKYDFVYLHVEAPDEAGHDGDAQLKKRVLEDIDSRLLSYIYKKVQENFPNSLKLTILPDHPTPVELRTHVREDVPYLLWGLGVKSDAHVRFTETVLHGPSLPRVNADGFFKMIYAS